MMTSRSLDGADLDFLRSVDSPTLANAIEVLRVRDRTEGFIGGEAQCLFPDLAPMIGRAVTVEMTNSPGHGADRTHYWTMWETLAELDGPSILVVQDVSGQPGRVAYFGEVMATLATRLGAVGLVTDGGVRDLDEVLGLGFQYFSPFPVVSHANFEVVSVGHPVTILGQRVETGDVLHGDKNGVVIIPDAPRDALEAAVEKIRLRERNMMDYINSDAFTVAGARETSGY